MAATILVHYGELALKGRNRPWFLSTMLRSMRAALAGLSVMSVRVVLGRIEIALGPTTDPAEACRRLSRLPGLSNFSVAERVPADVEAMTIAMLAEARAIAARGSVASFRVSARRADKRFPIPTPDLERQLGAIVQAELGWRVNLKAPAVTLSVEVLSREAYVHARKWPGAGGLPVGTSGKVLCLVSGGIDSPVAAWRMIRRGCRARFIHFHSYPILSRTSQDKVRTIVETLTRHQLRSRLYLVPFGPVQQQVVVSVPAPYRVVVYRRMMMRIAERIAARCGARALVTGDVIGQVASQTIENLDIIGSVATLPILRPLIGADKEEITAEAQRLETYETSIIEDEDCCSLFTPKYPITRTARTLVEAAEAELDVETLVTRAVAATLMEDFKYPMLRSAVSTDAAQGAQV